MNREFLFQTAAVLRSPRNRRLRRLSRAGGKQRRYEVQEIYSVKRLYMYRARLKGIGQVARMLQASSGRSGKQQQEQNSRNLSKAF